MIGTGTTRLMKRFLSFLLGLGLLHFACTPSARANNPKVAGKEGAPSPPPLPAIASLMLEPDSITLHDGRDARRVLVWGRTENGEQIDLTEQATFQLDTNILERADGYLAAR